MELCGEVLCTAKYRCRPDGRWSTDSMGAELTATGLGGFLAVRGNRKMEVSHMYLCVFGSNCGVRDSLPTTSGSVRTNCKKVGAPTGQGRANVCLTCWGPRRWQDGLICVCLVRAHLVRGRQGYGVGHSALICNLHHQFLKNIRM